MIKKIILKLFITTSLFIPIFSHSAPLVSPPTVPMETGTSVATKPNVMFILDDSGSMAWDYLGDELADNLCSIYSGSKQHFQTTCRNSGQYDVQALAYDVNKIYYNPTIIYKAPINYDSSSLGDQGFTTAKNDGFLSTGTTNLDNLTEAYYCTKSSPTSTELQNTAICRRNGVNNIAGDGTFDYYVDGYPNSTFLYRVSGPRTVSGVRFGYFSINPREYCDETFVNCSTTSSATKPYPAPVRWCKTQADAITTSSITGTSSGLNRCQKNYDDGNGYIYPKFGKFKRNNLTATELTNYANWYSYYRTRINAMKTSVGLAFANLGSGTRVGFTTINPMAMTDFTTTVNYSYTCKAFFDDRGGTTKDRIYAYNCSPSMPSSGTGSPANANGGIIRASGATNAAYNRNFTVSSSSKSGTTVTINLNKSTEITADGGTAAVPLNNITFSWQEDVVSSVSTIIPEKFLQIADFGTTHKQTFYDKLYKATTGNSTPLREALSRVGRYYAGLNDGINKGMIEGTNLDPIQYSCQQNFSILSTDGYWNGNNGVDLAGNAIQNEDNVNSGYSTRAKGSFDGAFSSAKNTLADTAMYYYKNDLRTTGSVSTNNVPVSINDTNPSQHMVTYAISLGLNGLMNYTPDYITGKNTDFERIKAGTADWPVPNTGIGPTLIDDLWHATVNGRGIFYSAQNSTDLINGLTSAISSLLSQAGASAAASTSSPNITPSENSIFSGSYRTVAWDGELKSNSIDPNTGIINPSTNWSARTVLNSQSLASSDTRNLYYMHNNPASSILKPFNKISMSVSELNNFTNKCSTNSLGQCLLLTPAQKTLIDNGDSLINYLRGQSQYDKNNTTNPLFRAREYTLGDIVNSSPVYVSKPVYDWTDTTYQTYKTANLGRKKMVYIGSNDGMMHAFDADTGSEVWGIYPRQTMSKLHILADYDYTFKHQFMVDGEMSAMDVQIGGVWKTVIVSGFSSGSKGYFAVDITDPLNPKALWESCIDPTLCSVHIPTMGFSYGNPIITKRYLDNKWVAYVTSGYDNTDGIGRVYELDIETGSVLRTFTIPGTYTNADQAGLSKLNAYFDNFSKENKAKYLYGGDLNGNIWKWDLSDSSTTTAYYIGTATDPSGAKQSITTAIDLGKIDTHTVLFVGTGKFLNTGDYSSTQVNSIYAFKDKGNSFSYGNFRDNSTLVKQTISPLGTLQSTATENSVDWNSKNGWYFDLTSQSGERVNVDVKLTLGVLNVISNVPGISECTAGGNAWVYQVDFKTGSFLDPSNKAIATKSTSGLIVGQIIVQLGKYGGLKDYITDAAGNIFGVTVTPKSLSTNTQSVKLYWREMYKK